MTYLQEMDFPLSTPDTEEQSKPFTCTHSIHPSSFPNCRQQWEIKSNPGVMMTVTSRKKNFNVFYRKSELLFIILSTCLLSSLYGALAKEVHTRTNNLSGVESRRTRNTNSNSSGHQHESFLKPEHLGVPAGGVIHLFPRYGYLSLSMRVISRGDKVNNSNGTNQLPPRNDSWIFLEPINNVIEPTTLKVEESHIGSNENDPVPFHNLFHIDLCEDIPGLLEAYFRNFSIEGLDKPWQAFSGGWRSQSISRFFGIEPGYIEGDYRYILVKVLLVRGSSTVVPLRNISASSFYQPHFFKFEPNQDLSTYEFFKVVGTHYVHASIIGNAVYQVFVYDPEGFDTVKRKLLMDGIEHQATSDFMVELPDILSTWVKYTGRVYVLNSSPDVTELIRRALTVRSVYSNTMTNLFKLHNNPELVREIERLLADQPSGVLGIDLRGIQFLFKDPIQRAGFEKALMHKMQLWEVNFQY